MAIAGYLSLIIMLRISGKRTLSKMNAFDSIITIALGSAFATVILNKDVVLAEGLLVFALLILLQFVATFASTRFSPVNRLVKSAPTLIAYRGKCIRKIMLKERITEDEVYAKIWESGLSSLEETEAVILETDGNLTVIKNVFYPQSAVMRSVKELKGDDT